MAAPKMLQSPALGPCLACDSRVLSISCQHKDQRMSDESPVEAFEHAEHAEHAAHSGSSFLGLVSMTIAILAVVAATVGSLEGIETAETITAKNDAVLLQNRRPIRELLPRRASKISPMRSRQARARGRSTFQCASQTLPQPAKELQEKGEALEKQTEANLDGERTARTTPPCAHDLVTLLPSPSPLRRSRSS